MGEGVVTGDGQAVPVPQAAQAPPEGGTGYAPPPRKAAPDPEAPYGRKADGSPRAKPGARPKTERPRTGVTEPPGAPQGAPAAVRDYSKDLAEFGQAVWMLTAAVPMTRPMATLIKVSLPGQVKAWNTAAQQSESVRGVVERLGGGPTWVVGVAVASAPLVGGTLAMMRDPELRAKLAAQAEKDLATLMDEAAEAMAAELDAQAAEAESAEAVAAMDAAEAAQAPA